MKRLVLVSLAAAFSFALAMILLPGQAEKQYEPRNEQQVEKAGFRGAIEWIQARRVNQETGVVSRGAIEQVQEQIAQLEQKKEGMDINWESRGPSNIGGRCRAILIDQDNPDIMYAGGVSGGLWKSTTGGGSWTQIKYMGDDESSDIPNLAVVSICQTTNGDIYFGTGEGHYKGYGTGVRGMEGAGIWKSTDGESFTRLESTWSDNDSKNTFNFVNEMVAHADDPNTVFAATNRGIMRTIDGGETWSNPVENVAGMPLTTPAGDVKISSDGTVLIADIGTQAYVSNDGGTEWEKVSTGGENAITNLAGRLEFDISPQDKNYIYCQASKNDGSLYNIYRSTDAGQTWTIIGPGGSEDFNPLGDQGTFDNVIAVYPDNKDEILVGGQYSIWHWEIDDGWEIRSYWSLDPSSIFYVHADHHEIIFHPDNPDKVFIGCDGGISVSNDRGNIWQTQNKLFNVTQFYSMAHSPTNELIGGTQDNGTIYLEPDEIVTDGTEYPYSEVSGGDGGYSAISHLNPNVLFSTVYYGSLYRSEEKGEDGTVLSFYDSRLTLNVTGVGEEDYGHNFITPIALWESFNDVNSKDTIEYAIPADMDADTTIDIPSESATDLYIKYTTDQAYNENDTIQIVDHFQAALAVGFNGSVWITREPVNFRASPAPWYPVADSLGGTVETLEWSKDGNHLYFSVQDGEVYRVSNFNNAYVDSLIDCTRSSCVLTLTKIAKFNRIPTDIAVDPSNPANVLVTLGNYDNTDYVYYTNTATTAPGVTNGSGCFSSKQGDLPNFPAYSGIILWNDSRKVLVGTEFGVYGTENILDANPSWTAENNDLDYVPVYMLSQQTFRNGWIDEVQIDNGVINHGHIWAATHGRGIFECDDFAGPTGIKPSAEVTDAVQGLHLYPNPASERIYVEFALENATDVSYSVFDMNGRKARSENLGTRHHGTQKFSINVNDLNAGMYFVQLKAGNQKENSRFIIK